MQALLFTETRDGELISGGQEMTPTRTKHQFLLRGSGKDNKK